MYCGGLDPRIQANYYYICTHLLLLLVLSTTSPPLLPLLFVVRCLGRRADEGDIDDDRECKAFIDVGFGGEVCGNAAAAAGE